jgi:hypothetical protein
MSNRRLASLRLAEAHEAATGQGRGTRPEMPRKTHSALVHGFTERLAGPATSKLCEMAMWE